MEGRRNFVVLSLFLVGFITYFLTSSTAYKMIIILYLIAVGDLFFKVDIMYPFVWLSPFLFLYGTAILFLDFLGVREAAYPETLLNCTFYSIVTFFVGCVLFIRRKRDAVLRFGFLKGNTIELLYRMLVVLEFILLLYIPLFLRSGYSSKMDTNLNGGLLGFGVVSRLFILVYIIYSIFHICSSKKFNITASLIALFISLLISLFLGERDVFFSIGLCSFLVYYRFFKPSLKWIALFATIGIILVPILGMMKQITNKSDLEIQQGAVIEGIFEGEFLSSGRNIEALLLNKSTWNYQYGEALYNDVVRSIVPSSISDVQNSTGWFNSRYNSRRDEGYGAGFSYVGEGYLQGDYVGIIIWMLLLTFIVKRLYYNSEKTVFGLAAYVFMICLIIYALRGDLSYILSPLIKQVFLGYVLLYYMHKIFGKKKANINHIGTK